MRITEDVQVTTKELRGIICNKCGKVMEPYDDKVQQFNLPCNYRCGNNIKFDLCEDCLLKIIKGFDIVPENFMSSPNYTSSFDLDPELHQQLFDEWKETDEWNCDDNPYKDYYDELIPEKENYEESSNTTEESKLLHTNCLKIVK